MTIEQLIDELDDCNPDNEIKFCIVDKDGNILENLNIFITDGHFIYDERIEKDSLTSNNIICFVK